MRYNLSALVTLIIVLSFGLWFTAGCGGDDDDETEADDDDDDAIDDDDLDEEPIVLLPSFPPIAVPGESYSHQFETEHEVLPYLKWEITHGDLPHGIYLDPLTGTASGTTDDEEGLYFFVVKVTDSSGYSDDEFFGVRVGLEGTIGPMRQREIEFTERYLQCHTCRGMTYACAQCDDPEGDYGFNQYGDSAMWSGTFCAGTAWRYAVTGDPEDLERVRLCAQAMDGLRRVTNQPGLLARGYTHKDDPFSPGEFGSFYPENPDSTNHRGEGDWEDFYWRGDVSRDQYTGVMLAWAMMHDLTDDAEIRWLASENIAALADHIWDHGLKIVESGEMTTHGELSGYRIDDVPFYNGFNAVICLGWFKLAHHITGEQRFLDYFNHLLIDQRYLWVADLFCYSYLGYNTKWYNVNMSFDNFYILLRMTRDTPLFDEVVRIMEKHVWLPAGPFPNQRHARLEGSAWFTFLYANGTGKRDPETIHRTLVFFSDYPMYIEKERHVDNHGREGVIPDPLHPEWALDPLPPKWRHSSNFIWQRCPYTIEGGDDLPRENSGNAYITPYWLGRYAGIIGEQW